MNSFIRFWINTRKGLSYKLSSSFRGVIRKPMMWKRRLNRLFMRCNPWKRIFLTPGMTLSWLPRSTSTGQLWMLIIKSFKITRTLSTTGRIFLSWLLENSTSKTQTWRARPSKKVSKFSGKTKTRRSRKPHDLNSRVLKWTNTLSKVIYHRILSNSFKEMKSLSKAAWKI